MNFQEIDEHLFSAWTRVPKSLPKYFLRALDVFAEDYWWDLREEKPLREHDVPPRNETRDRIAGLMSFSWLLRDVPSRQLKPAKFLKKLLVHDYPCLYVRPVNDAIKLCLTKLEGSKVTLRELMPHEDLVYPRLALLIYATQLETGGGVLNITSRLHHDREDSDLAKVAAEGGVDFKWLHDHLHQVREMNHHSTNIVPHDIAKIEHIVGKIIAGEDVEGAEKYYTDVTGPSNWLLLQTGTDLMAGDAPLVLDTLYDGAPADRAVALKIFLDNIGVFTRKLSPLRLDTSEAYRLAMMEPARLSVLEVPERWRTHPVMGAVHEAVEAAPKVMKLKRKKHKT